MKIKAKYNGEQLNMEWKDGKLTGHWYGIWLLKVASAGAKYHEIGPPVGPFTYRNHLKSEISTACLCLEVFEEEGCELSEFTQYIPAVPDGAYA